MIVAKAIGAEVEDSPNSRSGSMTPFTRFPDKMTSISCMTSKKPESLKTIEHPLFARLSMLMRFDFKEGTCRQSENDSFDPL